MENLDRQRLMLIALELEYVDLLNFCKSNNRINRLVCKYPTFWINKLAKDFNFHFMGNPDNVRNPKKYYKFLNKYYPFTTQEKINKTFEKAIYTGQLDLVQYMFSYGPKKEENLGGFQAFLLESIVKAIEKEHKNIADYLITFIDDKTIQSPHFGIVSTAAQKGYLDIVENFIPHFQTIFDDLWDRIMESGALGGQEHIVEYAIKNGAQNWDRGLFAAVEGNNDKLISFFVNKGARQWITALRHAMQTSNLKWVKKFASRMNRADLNKGGNINRLFPEAVGTGNMEIIDIFLKEGANNWDGGLVKASRLKNKPLIDFFISKGAKSWNGAMMEAMRGNAFDNHKIALVKFFVEKGAQDWEQGLTLANFYQLEELQDFFTQKLGNKIE